MKNNTNIFRCAYLSIITVIWITSAFTANADDYALITDIKGEVKISWRPFVGPSTVKVGAIIPTDADIHSSDTKNNYLEVICGVDPKSKIITSSAELLEQCLDSGRDAKKMRKDTEDYYPVVIFPHQEVVTEIPYIVWGNVKKSDFRLEIYDVSAAPKKLVLSTKQSITEDSPVLFNQYPYKLSDADREKFKKGNRYQIVVTDLNSGRDSSQNGSTDIFVFSLSNRRQQYTKYSADTVFTRLKNSHLFLNVDNDPYNSFYALGGFDNATLSQYEQFTRARIYLNQGTPADYTAHELLLAIIAAMKAEDKLTATMACKNLFDLYSLLSNFWRNRISDLQETRQFPEVCPYFTRSE